MRVAGWHVEVEFEEDLSGTKAAALLRLKDGTELRGRGRTTRDPRDPNAPDVGEEFAGARALQEITDQLMIKARSEVKELHRA
jgi:hypothetical protein